LRESALRGTGADILLDIRKIESYTQSQLRHSTFHPRKHSALKRRLTRFPDQAGSMKEAKK
jgi:hypothetical protein